MKVLSTEKKPIKMWLPYLEDAAEEQAKNLANLPFTFRHVAIMPDSHVGFGMPIGGVLATDGVVIPNAVGVDIGCGMCALKTEVTHANLHTEALKQIMQQIRETIPVGNGRGGSHKDPINEKLMPEGRVFPTIEKTLGQTPLVQREFHQARFQLGTLGGGNHFIEIQKDQNDSIWIMIHSGSRHFGKTVADHYNKLAVALNARWKSEVPPSWKLAFLPTDSNEGQAYLGEMSYCVEYALANRKLMMKNCLEAFYEIFRCPVVDGFEESLINIAHNYAAFENHFGSNVVVHRKGATRARQDETGIIPGSQGSKSYIVRGKGNPESFMSCSHGAGRVLGRRQATERLKLEEQIAIMDAQGIIHGIRNEKDLDEAPGAYKDIDTVMANQADLVEIVTELRPLAVIKG